MSKLTFVFSSMNSGKTLALLTKNFMLREKGYRTLLVKPDLDDRTTTISSRIGLKETCYMLSNKELLTTKINPTEYDYILVDEAQFLTRDQVWNLSDSVDYFDVNVICYGLKLNWKAELFEGSKALIELADELIQMDSFCKETGNPALFHHKLGGSDSTIETGYEDLYETVSRKVWKERKKNDAKSNKTPSCNNN
jgi:thymidine kinase